MQQRKKRGHLRLIVGIFLAFMLIFQNALPLVGESVAAAALGPLNLISTKQIGEGTTLRIYQQGVNGISQKLYVLQIDLNNPYVKIAPIYGKGGTIGKQPLSKMADENGAVAAINANFFNLSRYPAPFGMELKDGELITSQSKLNGWQDFFLTPDKTASIAPLGFTGQIITADGSSFPIFNLNKEIHNTHVGPSHTNRINLYTPRWGTISPGKRVGEPVVEVVVSQGVIREIRQNQDGTNVPADGVIITAQGSMAASLLSHLQVGDPIQVDYQVTPADQVIEQAIGTHALLVDQGRPVPIPSSANFDGAESLRARSAVGVSQDGKEVFLVALEKVNGGDGLSLSAFSEILAGLGIWRAANLDGGGSTTMVARMPGDEKVTLLNKPEGGVERLIPDGIAVFNTASPGALAGIILSGSGNILVGNRTAFQLKGYDEHILPYAIDPSQVEWHLSNPQVGHFEQNTFVAEKSGVTEVWASLYGVESNRLTLTVFGGEDLKQIEVIPAQANIPLGGSVSFTMKATTKNGLTFTVAGDQIEWQIQGLDGRMEGSTYKAGTTAGAGTLSGRLDGFSFSVPINQGRISRFFHSLEGLKGFAFDPYPDHVKGSFQEVNGTSGEPIFRGNSALKLTYQFTENQVVDSDQYQDNVEAAYGDLNDPTLTLPNNPIGIGLWVYGDNSRYWLRSQVTDAAGKTYLITLAPQVDWTGWKYVEGYFPAGIKYPVRVKSLYLVDYPDITDRPLNGAIYFDTLMALYPYQPSEEIATTPITSDQGSPSGINAKLGSVTLTIKEGLDRFGAVKITPFDAGKENLSIPGYNPYEAGFTLDADFPKNGALPVTLTQEKDRDLLLLYWSESDKKWVEVPGFYDTQKRWSFTLKQAGKYLPVEKHLPRFTDVKGNWAEQAIFTLASEGLIQGMSPTEFRPNEGLTRAQFVTLLYRLVKEKNPDALKGSASSNPFKDPLPEWAKTAILSAASLHWVEGYPDHTFQPDRPFNREEMAVLLDRVMTLLKISPPQQGKAVQLKDARSISSWAKTASEKAARNQLLPITNGTFQPKQRVTRAEAAQAFYLLYTWMATPHP